MILRLTAASVLGLALLAAPCVAQTVGEQMQKGIYAQETAGDLDAAIQIYRQILNSSPADRKYAAMAQFRLAQALLQKGDLQEAGREFQALANYPEYKDAIAAMARKVQVRGSGVHSIISRGTYTTVAGQGGHYSHKATGVDLTVPPGWSITDGPSSDGGDMAVLIDANKKGVVEVWMKAEQHPATELAAMLRHDLEIKPAGRSAGWKVRPESVVLGGAGEHQFLRAVADYSDNGVKMVEFLVWFRSTKTHALIFGSVGTTPDDNFPGYQENFARFVSTAVIP